MSVYDCLPREKYRGRSSEYIAKYLHEVPDALVIDRAEFLIRESTGKQVLDIGASGPMHKAVRTASRACMGIDRAYSEGIVGIDLDEAPGENLPDFLGTDLVICGEVLEHLSNPGHFLDRLHSKYGYCRTIFTVPNAFNEPARQWLRDGTENVNDDHVAWYSYQTLSVLLRRAKYRIDELYWYGGKPRFSEGLIAVYRGR